MSITKPLAGSIEDNVPLRTEFIKDLVVIRGLFR